MMSSLSSTISIVFFSRIRTSCRECKTDCCAPGRRAFQRDIPAVRLYNTLTYRETQPRAPHLRAGLRMGPGPLLEYGADGVRRDARAGVLYAHAAAAGHPADRHADPPVFCELQRVADDGLDDLVDPVTVAPDHHRAIL